jgi:hypothetical protein
LNSNFVVVRFGAKFRKEDLTSNVKPIQRTIDGECYVIYPLRRCIWQGTAGNLFLVKGEGYDDFIALFTTALNAKPETVIRKYKNRSQIEQTNKELKSYLGIEGSYFRKKEKNYGSVFVLCSVYNFIQYVRLYLPDTSFKDVLDGISIYLLRVRPPECVASLENAIERIFEDNGYERSNKINTDLFGAVPLSDAIAT